MIRCADCGALVQDGRQACGLCGSGRLYPPGENIQHIPSPQQPPQRTRLSVLIVSVAASVGVLIGGLLLVYSSISFVLSIIGVFMVTFAGVAAISAIGISMGVLRHCGRRSSLGTKLVDGERRRGEKEPD